jgi:hypothetical protein
MKTESYYSHIVHKLARFNRKEAMFLFLNEAIVYVILCLPIILLLLISESLISFSPTSRSLLLYILLVLTVLYFGFTICRYGFKIILFKKNIVNVARRAGQFYSDIKDQLANALQVYGNQKNVENYSLELKDASLQKVYVEIKQRNITKNIKWKQFKGPLKIFLLETVVFIVVLVLPLKLSNAFSHFLHPLKDYSPKALYSIDVFPGNISVVKDSDVTIKAWSDIPNLSTMTFHSDQKLAESLELQRAKGDTFKYVLSSLKSSLNYFVEAEDLKTNQYQITVLELPLIRRLQLHAFPPAYSNQESFLLPENVGDVSLLKGSIVEIMGETNKPIQQASVKFSHGKNVSLTANGRRITGKFFVQQKGSYLFNLVDQDSLHSENPVEYFVNVIQDQFPYVNLISPGNDIDLTEDMIIPIAIEATDDYGISKMRIAYQLIPEGLGEADSTGFIYQELSGFSKGLDQINMAFNWDLKSSEMMPTDVVVYFVEVYDTDDISGPKRSQTEIFRARFPSMYELYEELAGNQDETVESMESVYEKSKEIKEKLEKMSLDLRRAKELEWQQQQEIEDAVKAQKEMQKEIENLADKLENMISDMEKNDLVSTETLEKYKELQELMNEIMSPELKEAMEKVNKAMQDLDQNLVKKALEDLKLSQEDFNKSLDRSIELLKRLKVEQKLDQAAKMAKDLLERQEKLGDNVEAKDPDGEGLQADQENINKDTKDLSSALEKLSKEMKDMPGAPQDQVSQAQSQLQSGEFQKQMEDLQKSLTNNDFSKSQKLSQDVKNQMQSVSEQLQQAKDSMSGAMQMRMMQAMRQATRDVLQLSKQQEELIKETADTPANSAAVSELAEKQNNLSSALNRSIDQMFNASKENVFMGSKIGQELGKAASNMKQSIQHFAENSPQKARPKQGESMNALNDAFKALQQSMQQMMQGGGSGGMSMEQFLKQMQQMGKQQQGINQQTQGLGMGKQMSLARQAAMARLAAEQEHVRKSAEQLAKEAGEMDEILGDMDKIVDDMKDVEKDFYNNNINRQTIQRQNKILSRMLDAQKSMKEREYTNKREAETGQTVIAESPDDLPNNLGERKSQLQQDLLKAKKEGYTKDYLDLIRKYFKVLSEQDEYNK